MSQNPVIRIHLLTIRSYRGFTSLESSLQTCFAITYYLANMKLERAFYLIPTGKPMTDICMEAGFSSPSHMSDISRKLYGLSMTQVKKLFFGGHAPVELS